ncbi:MAG: hypothetical protein O2960_20670 [Verrucomicrobia bacterium]|nr:hypothetical protein [Verrucomicrobiota bacterium]
MSQVSAEYLAELRGLEYAEDFTLPEQAAKLAKVYEHTLSGGSFEVRKTMSGRTRYSPVVAVFDDFPSESQVLDAVYECYGGGRYSIYLEGQPGSIKSFDFPGRSKFHADGAPPKTARQELQDLSARYASEFLEKEINSGSGLGHLLQRALVAKTYGIELPESPPEPTQDEQWLAEYLEDNPEAKDAVVEAKLRKRGVKLPETKTEIDQLIDQANQMADLEEALAKYKHAGEPEPNLARDALQAFAAVARDLVGRLIDPKAAQTQIPGEPSTPVPQPDAANGSQAAQKQTGLGTAPASEPPPQSTPSSGPPRGPASPLDRPGTVEQPTLADQETEDIGKQTGPQTQGQALPTPTDPATMRSISAALRKEFAGSVDWTDLEQGINGDPAGYVEHLRDKAQEQGTGHGVVLGCLLDQESFLEVLNEAVGRLRDEPGRGEEYETAVLVLKHLSETEGGKRWLEEAHTAAKAVFDEVFSRGSEEHYPEPTSFGEEPEEAEPPLLI